MSAIRSKNTKPELRLRKALFSYGLRYRLHVRELSGIPDIVFHKYRVAIQVRGCFWHQHSCRDGHIPQSRRSYWGPKLRGNILRDKKNDAALKAKGWKLIIVWECQIRSHQKLQRMALRLANRIAGVWKSETR